MAKLAVHKKYRTARRKLILPKLVLSVFIIFRQLILLVSGIFFLSAEEIAISQSTIFYVVLFVLCVILLTSLLDYLISVFALKIYHRYEGYFTPMLYDQLFRGGEDLSKLNSRHSVFLRYGILRDIVQLRDSELQGMWRISVELYSIPLWLAGGFWLDIEAGVILTAHAAVMLILLWVGQQLSAKGQSRAEQVGSQMLDKLEIARNAGTTMRAMGLYAHMRQIWVLGRMRELLLHVKQAQKLALCQTAVKMLYLSSIVTSVLIVSADVLRDSPGLLPALMWVGFFAARPITDAAAMLRSRLKAQRVQPEVLRRVRFIHQQAGHWARELKGEIAIRDMRIIVPGVIDPILHVPELQVRPGETLGIIGNIGSGKSALCKLLAGIESYDGSALLDGVEYRDWNPELLGSHIGYLPQEIDLLPGTVSENICRFMPNAREDDVVSVAKLAGADEHIRHLAKSYATEISVGDDEVPYGLKQRIAIARAFFGMPQLIVLDAVTAQLDQKALQDMRSSILTLKQMGKTIILATHSRSFLEITDHIAVLHDKHLAAIDDAARIMQKM